MGSSKGWMTLDSLDKKLGIPSLATLVLGMSLFLYAGNSENRYRNFIKEISRTTPIVKQLDTLEGVSDDLYDSRVSLTYYETPPKPSTYYETPQEKREKKRVREKHDPNVNQALRYLGEAQRHTHEIDTPKNPAIEELSEKIKEIKTNLRAVGMANVGMVDEQFYEELRAGIRETEGQVHSISNSLKRQVPTSILEKRESLRNPIPELPFTGFLIGFFGFMGLGGYVLTRLNRRQGLEY